MCIVADQQIAAEEVVGSIPQSLALTSETAWQSVAGRKLSIVDGGRPLTEEMMLCYYMIRGHDSGPWAEYLQTLPEREPIPVAWDNDCLTRELKGTPLYDAVMVSVRHKHTHRHRCGSCPPL